MSLQVNSERTETILSKLQPYLVCTPYNRPFLDTAPYGAQIPEANIINPLIVGSETFLDLLQIMDALTFGPEGMPMSRWVFYDGSELPGGIFGFGMPASDVDAEIRKSYHIPDDYEGLVPFSMYIAIPTPEKDTWFGHNLASLNPVFPDLGLSGLGTVTKSLGLKAFGCDIQVGATQWDSSALFIHTRFGPLELETAFTPAHSEIMTLTYIARCTDNNLKAALGDPGAHQVRPEADLWIRSDRPDDARALHLRIEAGEKFCVCDRPRIASDSDPGHEKVLEVPVAKIS
jgi:hypothetical protein